MAPRDVVQAASSSKTTQKKRKRNSTSNDVHASVDPEGPASSKAKLTNEDKFKQKTLLLSSRGVTYRMRHVMNDLSLLLPNLKKGLPLSLKFPSPSYCAADTGWNAWDRGQARYEAPALHGERACRSQQLQQRNLLRSSSPRRLVHVAQQSPQRPFNPISRAQLSHHGRAQDDGKLSQREQTIGRL